MTLTSKTTRTEAAIQLRDHALAIVRRHGSHQPVSTGQKFLTWKGAGFAVMLRTPFQEWSTDPDVAARTLAATHGLTLDHAKYLATLNGLTLPEVLPYGIDVWQGKKVFSMEWADDGHTRVISFKRGDWEAEFLTLTF